jgi:peptide/nickel transport system permease protein
MEGSFAPYKGEKDRRFLWIGGGILLFFIIAGFWSMLTGSDGPALRGIPFQTPCRTNLLGTDDMGRDILSSLWTAGRISLLIGISAAVIAVGIGTIVGISAGYMGRPWSDILTGIIDAVLLIPMLPLMMVLAAYLGQHIINIILAIAIIGWCGTARAVRAKVLQLRETPFIEALEALGLSRRRILFYHMLPNVTEIISAKFVLAVAGAMLAESALSFMGLGDPTRLSWGKMVHDAFQRGGFANGLWNWYLPPGLCITFCTMSFVFLGLYWEQHVHGTGSSEWMY